MDISCRCLIFPKWEERYTYTVHILRKLVTRDTGWWVGLTDMLSVHHDRCCLGKNSRIQPCLVVRERSPLYPCICMTAAWIHMPGGSAANFRTCQGHSCLIMRLSCNSTYSIPHSNPGLPCMPNRNLKWIWLYKGLAPGIVPDLTVARGNIITLPIP